jgi:hypothetical protein
MRRQRLFASIAGKSLIHISELVEASGWTEAIVAKELKRLGWKKQRPPHADKWGIS